MNDIEQHLGDEELEFLLNEKAESTASRVPVSDEERTEAQDEIKPTIHGDLSQVNLADIFQSLVMSQMDGTLRVTSTWQTAYVLLNDRYLRILLEGDAWAKRMGYRLVSTGLMDSDSFKSALLQAHKQGVELSQIIQSVGFVDGEQFNSIRAGVEEDALVELFALRKGSFAFFSEAFPQMGLEERFETCVPFESSQFLLEVARKSDEWQIILEDLQDLGDIFISCVDFTEVGELDELKMRILEQMDGTQSVSDIGGGMIESLFDIAKAVHALYREGLIERAPTSHLLGLARADIDADNRKSAKRYIKLIKETRPPATAEELEFLARIQIDLGNTKEGGETLANCARLCEAIEHRLELLKEARRLNSRSLFILEELSKALYEYDPENPGELYFDVTRDLSDLYMQKNELEKALQLDEGLEELEPYNLALISHKARILHKMDRTQEAVKILKDLAAFFRKSGETQRLTQTLEQILRFDKGNSKARNELLDLRAGIWRKLRRYLAVACVVGGVAFGGYKWFENRRWLQQGRQQIETCSRAIAEGKLDAGLRTAQSLVQTYSGTQLGTQAANLVKKAKSRMANEAKRREAAVRKRFTEGVATAVDYLLEGRFKESLTTYRELMTELGGKKGNRALAKKVVLSVETRFRSLERQLRDDYETLKAFLEKVGDPTNIIKALTQEQIYAQLNKLYPTDRDKMLRNLHAALDDKQLGATKGLPPNLKDETLTYLLLGRRAEELRRTLWKMIKHNQSRIAQNKILTRARNLQQNIDWTAGAAQIQATFKTIRSLYAELLRKYKGAPTLLANFRTEVERYDTILNKLEKIRLAAKKGDFGTSMREFEWLLNEFPQIPFHRFVSLPLAVTSTPKGATVLVNGKPRGKTPLVLTFLLDQEIKVGLRLDGYEPVKFHGKPENGRYHALLELRPDWKMELDGTLTYPGVLVEGGNALIITDRSGDVAVIDLRTKRIRFRKSSKDLSGDLGTPITYNGFFVVVSRGGLVRAIDTKTGEVKWSNKLPGPLRSTAAKIGEHVLVASEDGKLSLLHRDSGEDIKTVELGARIVAQPISDRGKRAYVVDMKGRCHAIADSGRIIWTAHVTQAGVMPPVVYRNQLLIPTDDMMLKSIDTDGHALWKTRVGDALRVSPSVVDGKIYVANGNRELLELRMTDGKLLRKKPIYARPTAPLRKVGNVLILPIRERGAYVILHDSLELDGFFAAGLTSEVPVIGLDGNHVIFATNKGRLLGFRLR